MSDKKQASLKVNFILNAILTMSGFIFPLISFPYVSRILKPVGTGKVQFASSVVSYFAMFAALGTSTYGVRACAKVRDDKEQLSKTTQEIFYLNVITGLVSYVLLIGSIIAIPKLRNEKWLYFITSLLIFFNAIGMEWLYKGLEKYKYITVRSVLFKLIALVGMFLLIHKKADYEIYAGLTIFASSASGILNFLNARKYVSFKRLKHYDFKPHLKALLVFFAMSCATTIYLHLDTVMLGFMTSDTDVGYYNASVKIKTILVSVVTSLGAVLLPRAAYYVEHNLMDEFRRITRKAINFVWIFATPLMVYFMIFASEGIYFLSGKDYAAAIVPMIVITPTTLLIGLTNIMGIEILVPTGREKLVLYSEIAGAIVDLILNAILIPQLKSTGAAIGTLVAELVVFIYQYIALRKEVKDDFKVVSYWKIMLALIFASGASFWVKLLPLGNSMLHSFIKLGISAVLFYAVYGMVLLLTKEKMTENIFGTVMKKLHRKN
ncbi:MAG: flippase [Eubacterium sp.]|nr:flippase [Eubacterium sp.]